MKKSKLGKGTILVGGCLFLVLLLINQASAAVVSSTFDTGMDGWTGLGAVVAWDSADGNPPGSLRSGDNDNAWAQVVAPAKFHGAWLSTGNVSADIKFKGTGGHAVIYSPVFAVSDGNTSYQYIFNPLVNTSWQTFSVSLNDSHWTRITSNSQWYNWNPPTGTESLSQVLQNVTDFHIRTDYTGDSDPIKDAADLDNIKATWASVPLPPTVLLLGSGIMGLLGLAWRRRRLDSRV